uniref:Putative WD40/YVTN repeat-like-containing domain-containing protein n=1 Tax=Helianthus annuus TaxID=4232 RepID=A0A251V968_HELAN
MSDEMGSSSVSPLIVTGGKGGDVGVHDLRYIATRNQKNTKILITMNKSSVHLQPQVCIINTWIKMEMEYCGTYQKLTLVRNVTRISAIPNTSFFLTGSKDRDVKLWDAKRATLVYHWQKNAR